MRFVAGVWPNDFNGDYPCNCGGDPFDLKKLKSIEDQLDKFWPSLQCSDGSCNDGFWEHEWSKVSKKISQKDLFLLKGKFNLYWLLQHGTCAVANISSLNGQLDYFKRSLQLRHQFDALSAFQQAGITPTNDHGYKVGIFCACYV